MFSHSCPSQVHSLSRRPHKEHAQCGVIYYTLQYEPGPCKWGVGGGGIILRPMLVQMAWFLNWSMVWALVWTPKDDDDLISWHSAGHAGWLCSSIFNVYIQAVGTNRACGSFTMQGICGWPIHSESWLYVNAICQTQWGCASKATTANHTKKP